jgi:hypothetical protein
VEEKGKRGGGVCVLRMRFSFFIVAGSEEASALKGHHWGGFFFSGSI